MGRKSGVTQSQERVTLAIALRDVSGVVLSLPKIGRFRIAEIPSRLSQQFYNALLQLCPEDLRTSLQNDDALSPDDVDSWWYILNEMLCAGVQLPIVNEVNMIQQYEPEPYYDDTPMDWIIDGEQWRVQLQMRDCGVKKCKRCGGERRRRGHGPYWFAYRCVKGKRERKYIGKVLPE